MLLRLCQLKSLSVLLLSGALITSCSSKKSIDPGSELMTRFPHHWFSANPDHALVDSSNAEPLSHIFFDTTPNFESDRFLNVVVSVPEGSHHDYEVDLNSGQRYYTHSYCKQHDVWNSYTGTLFHPTFSIALLPRVLDQLGEPQKVIVFSKSSKIREQAATNYHRVKLVGAYVEQICPEGNCLGKSNWLSRLVFIAVDAEDPTLVNINTIDEFTKAFDWETGKALLGNIDGRNFIGDNTYPATRVGNLLPYEEAFDYFKKRSIFLTDVELKKIQKGCHGLYDKLWDEVGKEHPEDRPARTQAELNEKIKLKEKFRKEKKPFGFAPRFREFTKKYFNEVSTCEKFVYHGNLNRNPEVFWFHSYVGIFYRLHREGYYFDCRNKAWQRNVLNEQGKPVNDIRRDIDLCKEAEIDQAMEYLPNFLTGLKNEKEYFRFIDYDNHPYGTHSKLYSWVKVKNRKFDCGKDPNIEARKSLKVFPEDIKWKERNIKDIADELKIIY